MISLDFFVGKGKDLNEVTVGAIPRGCFKAQHVILVQQRALRTFCAVAKASYKTEQGLSK